MSLQSERDKLSEYITRRNELNRELSQAIRDRQPATASNRRESINRFDEMIATQKRTIEEMKNSMNRLRSGGGGLDRLNKYNR